MQKVMAVMGAKLMRFGGAMLIVCTFIHAIGLGHSVLIMLGSLLIVVGKMLYDYAIA